MTEIPKELIAAYEGTDFRVLEPQSFTLWVGLHFPELQELYNDIGVSSAGYLTAWNPYSAQTSDEENKRSQEALLRKLSLEGFPALGALGVDPSDEWPGEDSDFDCSRPRPGTNTLGAEFGQNAIVWAVMHQKVTYNRYYPTQKQFANAILRFFRKTIPSEWKVFRDQVSDNFRVITHEKVRVLG